MLPVATQTQNQAIILGYEPNDYNTESRLRRYVDWMDWTNRVWWRPNLLMYRDYLTEEGLAPRTVMAYLSTVRKRYRQIILNRDLLFAALTADLQAPRNANDWTNRITLVNEAVKRIEGAIHPDSAPVEVVRDQDRPDSDFVWLTPAQALALMRAPGCDDLRGVRDTALIALLLTTGMRAEEATDLQVGDHTERLAGSYACYVRNGKGGKARLVPYGDMDWVIMLVNRWLNEAKISEGTIFRGTLGEQIRGNRMTTRTVFNIISGYPIPNGDHMITVAPHDLRRSYAKRMYDMGADLVAIQQNLGHSNLTETLGYIGGLDVERRRPKALWEFVG